jgi:ubiquinone/menaquinone biosynthesis C-methylase UbiE
VDRLDPFPGEKCLDVAARGTEVTGVDIGSGVIEAAKELAPDIDFRVGDAEQLDFQDGSFDVVTSTFGVMFVARPEAAASELARVCKKGGRLGLCSWLPGSTVEGLFQVMRPYMPPPATTPPPSPFEWGTGAHPPAVGRRFRFKIRERRHYLDHAQRKGCLGGVCRRLRSH